MRRLLLLFWVTGFGYAYGQVNIQVDPEIEHQKIQGFGAFGGIKAYWENPPFYTDAFIDYFLDDLGATIVRTNIFWDLEPENDNNSSSDLDLSKFNYGAGSNLGRQLPYYVALKEAGLKKLIATSWTPPDWMKLHDDPDRIPEQCYNCNNCSIGDPRRKVCGGRLDPKYYGEYAEYLLAYVKILKQEADIDLYGLSIQNEPYFANPFESNVVLPEEYGKLLNVVGRRFRQEGLNTRIFGPEHMAEWSWGVQQNYVNNVFQNGENSPYLDIYAVHGYVDGVAPDFGSAEGWTALKNNISDEYDKPLWMTETSGYAQTHEGVMELVRSMYLALRFGDISAWVYWSVSGEPGSEFSIMANGEPTVLYHASKQYFRYIRPGAIRVDASSEDPEILTLAFKNPSEGSMTLVLINTSEAEKEVVLNIPSRPAGFDVYRTSASENSAEVGKVTDSIILPTESITTLVGYGPSGPAIDEVPNQYLFVGDDETLTIPMSGISDGNGGTIGIEVVSSNTAIVPSAEVQYTYPNGEGVLVMNPVTSSPGKSVITLKLSNTNEITGTGFGFSSTEISFNVEVIDVVTDVKKKVDPEVKIFPNPAANGKMMIDFSGPGANRSVLISDILGTPVFSIDRVDAASDQLVVDTHHWKPGVYVVRISSGRWSTFHKIMVN